MFISFLADQPKKNQTHGEGPNRDWTGDIGPTSSDSWRGTQERLDRRHGSDFYLFGFCIFLVDQRKYKKSDPWRGTQERLNRRQPELQTTCPQSQRKNPMKKNKNTKIADHMSTESDKSPNGVCNFVFLIFKVFAWSAPNGQNLENPKNHKKIKTMGSAVLFFLFF